MWEYYFSKSNGRLGAWHSGEMIYVYGNLPQDSRLFDTADHKLSETMRGFVLNFMRTGDPNGEGLPAWEINTDSARMMEFGTSTGMIDEKYLALYEVMDRMAGWER